MARRRTGRGGFVPAALPRSSFPIVAVPQGELHGFFAACGTSRACEKIWYRRSTYRQMRLTETWRRHADVQLSVRLLLRIPVCFFTHKIFRALCAEKLHPYYGNADVTGHSGMQVQAQPTHSQQTHVMLPCTPGTGKQPRGTSTIPLLFGEIPMDMSFH